MFFPIFWFIAVMNIIHYVLKNIIITNRFFDTINLYPLFYKKKMETLNYMYLYENILNTIQFYFVCV